jgi:TolB-like protein/tetratricopeptide (TPR) repeat protein
MGVVYRARDTRLGRSVAIKLVENPSVDDRGRAQLLREAQHVSALNHPHICTIHEVGEADGRPFIVMEYVEGQPLSALIPKGGLSRETVVRYGSQIADALGHAHDHAIIHRDLKTSNVVITPDGRAKVLDFGLAKRTWHEGAALAATVPQTQPGTIVGTIAYMAPELLQGGAADARSDIWTLGVMLYEMTTGVGPFQGRTEFELSSQILREPPRQVPPDAPADTCAVILRCLEKDPRQRYQRAAEVRAALDATQSIPMGFVAAPRRVTLPGARLLASAGGLAAALILYIYFFSGHSLTISSIAVVPFVSVGSDPETEYLVDGLTEGVVNSLAQWPQGTLKVIALNSVLRYKGREIDPQTVGHDLDVGAIATGRVVQRSDALSVSAELVKVSDRSRMWGTTLRARVADFPAVEEEIAAKISGALRVGVKGDQKKRSPKRYTDNIEAYQLYLKGRYFWNKYTEEGWAKAIEHFDQAIKIDPGYAPAWAGIADSYYQLSSLVLVPGEAIPKARAAAVKALEIDENLAEAHASLGIIKAQYDWDRAGAAKEFRRAIELNSNYATGHQWYGMYLFANGQFDEALAQLTHAHQLDPLSLIIAVTATWPLPHLRRSDEAITQLQKIMEMYPNVPDVEGYYHDVRGELDLQRGLYNDAVTELLQGYRTKNLTPDRADTRAALKKAYEVSGLTGYWRQQLEQATEQYRKQVESARHEARPRYVSAFRIAELYSRLGDKENAFALLQTCYEGRDESLVWLKAESLKPDSAWESLRPDPRFRELLRRIGLET